LLVTIAARKLYFEIPEYNMPEIQSVVDVLLHREGVLKNHSYYAGRYWNRNILALYREDYEAIGTGLKLGRRRREAHL
jgi:hypothetical protein